MVCVEGVGAMIGVATVAYVRTGVIRPVRTRLVSRRAGRSEQGVVLGLNQSLMLLATVIAPAMSGFLIGEKMLTGWALLAAFTAGPLARGPGAQLFDAGGACRPDGITCLSGQPATSEHVEFWNLTVNSASDNATGRKLAVATILAAAYMCE